MSGGELKRKMIRERTESTSRDSLIPDALKGRGRRCDMWRLRGREGGGACGGGAGGGEGRIDRRG
ncbi:hypothetical protein E2C01_087643 [Portunus trituberculatus]|uniref:Uncharacterized protein n=1 Tax=Portunus trituberculatus TaxID=210409 RepID=A0A5B7JHU0_PORTR|nr:hypothetical protein [Portunus trituberculatus]